MEEKHVLSCHRTALVNERGVVLYDALCYKVVELSKPVKSVVIYERVRQRLYRKQVFALPCSFEVPPAERQSAKCFVDRR